jgi:FAD binding domain
MRTQVGIVGAGPAGLRLPLMPRRRGVGSVVVEARGRDAIEATIRDGIPGQSAVDLMAGPDSAGPDDAGRELRCDAVAGAALLLVGDRHAAPVPGRRRVRRAAPARAELEFVTGSAAAATALAET